MTTLKISNLSVGDWVQDNYGNYVKVEGIWQGSNFNYHVDARRDGMIGTTVPCNIHPIPITAEILEKNGFMRCSDEFIIYEYTTLLGKILRTTQVRLGTLQCINVFLHDATIERGYYKREKTSVSILKDEVYIHDLQHALRLAGIDKEINL